MFAIHYFSEAVRLDVAALPFELRLKDADGIARVFYCVVSGRRIVMLHSFIKKTQATPKRELEIARRRKKEMDHA